MKDELFFKLQSLRLPHYVNDEDNWYSCPASGQCLNDAVDDECNCGALKHNRIVDECVSILGKLP